MIKSKSKKMSRIIITGILVLLVALTSTAQKLASGTLPVEFYPEENFSWTVEDISVGNNVWINSTEWYPIANWHATSGSEINYSISDVLEISGKYFSKGDFEIGNFSMTTNDHAIGTNLALSYYPWVGGLISLERDWTTISDGSPFSTNTNITIDTESIATTQGVEVNAVKFSLNDTLQQTELIYEYVTGILVYAKTNAFGFNLEIRLSSSSIPLPAVTGGLPQPGLVCFLSGVAFLTLFTNVKRKRS